MEGRGRREVSTTAEGGERSRAVWKAPLRTTRPCGLCPSSAFEYR